MSDALEGRVDEAEQAVHSDEAAASRAHQLGIAPTDAEVTTTASEQAVLWLDDIVAGYGAVEVLHGAVDHHPTGRGRRPPGRQRRGQVDALFGGRRSRGTDLGRVVLDGTNVDERTGGAPCPSRDAADPGGQGHLPRIDRRGEPEGAAARRRRAQGGDRAVPHPRRTPRPARRAAVRRRAADAEPGAGAGPAARGADRRRADPRAVTAGVGRGARRPARAARPRAARSCWWRRRHTR